MKIFSTTQINITTTIAGPIAASYLLARNYKNSGQKKASLLTKFLGYMLALVIYICTVIISETVIIPTDIFKTNSLLGYVILLSLFIFLQALVAFLFSFKIKRTNATLIDKFSLTNSNTYSFIHTIPFILLGLTITFFLFVVGPFWFVFLAIYVLPNIYLHNRVKPIFVSKRSSQIFTFTFIVLVALFPVTEIIHHFPAYTFVEYALLVGYYYLPVMLYCFLLYIIVDGVLLLNRFVKLIPMHVLTSQKFRLILFGVILLTTSGIVIKGVYNFNHTQIQKYTIGVEKRATKMEHVRIAMAADFHFSEITDTDFITQFIEKINSIHPDIVLLAGDIVESDKSNAKMVFFEEQLRKIDSKYGVYAIEGNHDIYSQKNSYHFLENANIKIIRDTVFKIDNSFQLIGRRDRHYKNRKLVADLVATTNDSLPVFLLDHQPYNLENSYNSTIDVQFSGHTHHGQLFPLNFITEWIYDISWGYKKIENTHFFVTCGAQGWGPQVKTGSQSEIIQVDIDFL